MCKPKFQDPEAMNKSLKLVSIMRDYATVSNGLGKKYGCHRLRDQFALVLIRFSVKPYSILVLSFLEVPY